MTKYTREQVIEKLKKLKAGDELVGVKDYYTEGRRYKIEADDFGDLYVIDDGGSRGHVRVDGEYGFAIAREIMNGMLDFIEDDKGYDALTEMVKSAHRVWMYAEFRRGADNLYKSLVEVNEGCKKSDYTAEERVRILEHFKQAQIEAFDRAIKEAGE